jgi:hypothetical protein
MEYKINDIVAEISKTHLLIRKGKAYGLIGGFFAFFVTLGIFTYTAALDAAKKAAANEGEAAKLAEIKKMHSEATTLLTSLRELSSQTENLVEEIPSKYEAQFATFSRLKDEVHLALKEGESFKLIAADSQGIALTGFKDTRSFFGGNEIVSYNIRAENPVDSSKLPTPNGPLIQQWVIKR